MPLDINGGVSIGSNPQAPGDRIAGDLTVNGVLTYADSLLPVGVSVIAKPTQYTVAVTDSGSVITTGSSATTTITYTLPTADSLCLRFMYTSADGAHQLALSPQAADKIVGIGGAGVANKDMILTAAVAKRGDYITLTSGGTTAWCIVEARGAWSREG